MPDAGNSSQQSPGWELSCPVDGTAMDPLYLEFSKKGLKMVTAATGGWVWTGLDCKVV